MTAGRDFLNRLTGDIDVAVVSVVQGPGDVRVGVVGHYHAVGVEWAAGIFFT